MSDPQPAVDGGDGSASCRLNAQEQEALCSDAEANAVRPQGDLTGAELGAGSKTLHHRLSDACMSLAAAGAIHNDGAEYV